MYEANLVLERHLATLAQTIVISLVNGRQIPLRHHVGSNQLADFLREAELPKIVLSQDFVAGLSYVRAMKLSTFGRED
jgi:hypothetical protein